jgi:hypothetical protein
MPTLLDLRSEQKNPFPAKQVNGKVVNTSKVVAGKTVVRDPKTITGVGIHQTACVFGPSSDRAKAHRRALNIPAHVTAFRDGVFVAAAPLEWFLYHGNALNSFSLGLECEGNYSGLLSKPSAVWSGKPSALTDEAIETFRQALKWLVDNGRAAGMPIEFIWGHRQSNGKKPSDPGEGIWKHVVLDYGIPVLGLKTQPGKVWRNGKTIPPEWDPNGVGKY